MKSFNEYWKEKSTKRRKSWLAKSKRYAENHEKLETIRKEVYIPLDFKPNTSLDDLKLTHFTVQNPLVRWDNAVFSFSEEGLRSALKAQGADMTTFRMEVSRESIKGKAAPLPENSYGLNKWDGYTKLNRVYDFDRFYFDWLLRIYDICTDMETVRLSYKQISMTIRRYSNEGQPFAYYELNPCEQLCHSAILFQETDFYTLDTATLLMEMAEEWELRQEELNYHAKKLKLRSMDATTTDTIEFTLWDDKKIIKKSSEYIEKGYSLDKIVQQLLIPWKSAVKKFIDARTEVALNENVAKFDKFNTNISGSSTFIENVFCPFIEKDGDDLVEIAVNSPYDFTIKVSDSSCRMLSSYDGIRLYPNANFVDCFFVLSYKTPLSAISEYIKMMTVINPKVDEVIVTALHQYDRLVLHGEKLDRDRQHLDELADAYVGKPVGNLMKYFRWCLCGYSHAIPVQTIKVISENSFSYESKNHPWYVTNNGQRSVSFEDQIVRRWIDPASKTIYAHDPQNAEADKVNDKQILRKRVMWTIHDFTEHYLTGSTGLALSFEFINSHF